MRSLDELVDSIRQHGCFSRCSCGPAGPSTSSSRVSAADGGEASLRDSKRSPAACSSSKTRRCARRPSKNLQGGGPQRPGKGAGVPGLSGRFSTPLDDVARQLSMSRSSVCNFLRLFDLSDFVGERCSPTA